MHFKSVITALLVTWGVTAVAQTQTEPDEVWVFGDFNQAWTASTIVVDGQEIEASADVSKRSLTAQELAAAEEEFALAGCNADKFVCGYVIASTDHSILCDGSPVKCAKKRKVRLLPSD